MSEGIVIARIARPWGNRGEVTADILTDFPERFDAVERVTLRRGSLEREAELEGHRFHKGRVLLKFQGSDSISDAELLAGYDVVVSDDELHALPEGEDIYYDFQLVGCSVETPEGERVGEVASVMRTGGGIILALKQPNGREALVPFVDDICSHVDVEAKRIVAALPEGLLDL